MNTHFVVLIVVLIGLMSTLVGYTHITQMSKHVRMNKLNRDVVGIRDQIQRQLMRYELGLEFGKGFVLSSDYVSREEWKRFYNTKSVETYFPGVMGFGYVEVVEPGGVDGFVEKMREGGAADYSVKVRQADKDVETTGPKYLIKYLEPKSHNRGAWGLDVAANPANREVYDRARDLGVRCVSKPIQLFQDGGDSWGIVFVSPIYEAGVEIHTVEQRRKAADGWVVTSVGLNRFMAAEWQGNWNDFGVEIYPNSANDQSQDQLLYASNDVYKNMAKTKIIPLTIGDLELGIRLIPHQSQGSWFASPRQVVVVAMGLLTTVLLAMITWAVTQTRSRALGMARSMTNSLRESEHRQRQLALQASSANRSKSEFLANMSHEIRTPMTAILGYGEMLEENITSETSTSCIEAIGAIQRAGNHLMGVINDVLDLSKVESGKMPVHMESCPIIDTVEDVYTTLLIGATKAGLDLRVEFLTGMPSHIETDTYRVRQILLNLVGNAVKYTPSGSVSIQLSSDESNIRLAVKDTGVGISESEIESLLVPFVQAGDQAAHRSESTGLGLSIAHHLALLLGGRLDIESVVGEGSVFTLVLPMEHAGDDVVVVHSLGGLNTGRGPGGVERRESPRVQITQLVGRVLLAEDSADNQRLIVHFLTRIGLEVVVVENGQLAIDVLSSDDSFDLVLMDIQMPVVDGYQATRILRDSGCTLPIVALTAHAMDGAREKCLDAGCNNYVAKPINRRSLYEVIEQSICGSDSGDDRHQTAA